MAGAVSEFQRAYNSFSGVDIKAQFGNKAIGTLQAVSFSITREKAPVYTMGSADPRSYSRGKRGIAGTLIFIVFDRHMLLEIMRTRVFQSDIDDIHPVGWPNDNVNLEVQLTPAVHSSTDSAESDLTSVLSDQRTDVPAWYSDQIPPFDIVLAANNEYGASAKMVIYGVEILNEGSGVSIDDIVIEQQITYAARMVFHWAYVTNPAGARVGKEMI